MKLYYTILVYEIKLTRSYSLNNNNNKKNKKLKKQNKKNKKQKKQNQKKQKTNGNHYTTGLCN
jgi:hypothetical protein